MSKTYHSIYPRPAQRSLGLVQHSLGLAETDRILLRPWLESDAPTLYKYASDPDVGPRAGWPPHKSVEESREVIKNFFSNEYTWAIELKETSEIIGCIGYLPSNISNLKINDDECEIGYWVAKPYWGKGICTEALRLVIDYCFNVKNFTTLWGDYFPENPASGKVMEKCGFKDTGKEVLCPNLEVGADRPVKVMKLKNHMIAFCGLNCAKCDAFIATKNNDNALREKTAKLWSELNQIEILPEQINCEGCRCDGKKTVFCDKLCQIRQCAMKKGFETCGDCSELDNCKTVAMVVGNNPEALKNLNIKTKAVL